MHKQKVVIIGSGLGGLSCGVILAKNGYEVLVLEQSHQIGGCLQCFTRRGVKFETGMHFIGSAAEGQTMSKLMRYLEIDKKVKLSPLDPDRYEVVGLNGKKYEFPIGKEAFIARMSEYFPTQRDNIARYYELIEKIANASPLRSLQASDDGDGLRTTYQLKSINEVIDGIITDPLLSKVLVGNLPLYAAETGKTPFSTHAYIMDFYNNSAFRIVGGSDRVALALRDTIVRYGGQVIAKNKVTKIACDEEKAIGVEVNNEEFIPCDYILSDAHPVRTLELLDSKMIRPAFRKRINSIPQTVGCFSVYLHFKENALPYMNYNYYGYNTETPWGCENYTDEDWPKGFLYMHFSHEISPQYAQTGIILSYMKMEEVEKWRGTQVGRRGREYEELKRRKAERLISSLENHCPETIGKIAHYYTSTPLTYLNYTGTADGSMYGNAKNISLGAVSRVSHRTKIPNLFQTGQNINSHGMLGVMVGTIVTCSEFIGAETIYKQIKEANA